MNGWIAVVGLLMAGTVHAAPVMEGTWKIREPLTFEVADEVCEVRRGVAYLYQDGDAVSGRYEAQFSCWSPYAPEQVWQPRAGEVIGSIDGSEFTLELNLGAPFPVELSGTIAGERIVGAFVLGDAVQGRWSAARIGTVRPRAN